jgi:hypothetical protein
MRKSSSIAHLIAGATTAYCVMKAASSIVSRRRTSKVTSTQDPLDEGIGESAYTGSDYGMAPWQARDGPMK